MDATTYHNNLLVEPNDDGFAYAAKLIQNGDLLAFPTETVYGLGANALNESAVRSIFAAKGRPLTDPLIVHVADLESAHDIIELKKSEERIFKALTELFWPGPLTLIVKAGPKIPAAVTANTGFVGVRYPNHPLACRLIRESKLPIAAPSANRFGHVSPTRAAHVLADLGVKGVHVLHGESELLSNDKSSVPCEFGIESTVLKVDGEKKQLIIFRQGAITQTQLENIVNRPEFSAWSVVVMKRTVKMHSTEASEASNDSTNEHSDATVGQEAPGQAITHYAPDVPCYIVQALVPTADSDSTLSVSTAELMSGCVVLDYHGALSDLAKSCLAYRDLSPSGDAKQAAYQLFDTLRWSETIQGASKVLIASIVSEDKSAVVIEASDVTATGGQAVECDLTLGVADRVFRAASGQFVNLHISSS